MARTNLDELAANALMIVVSAVLAIVAVEIVGPYIAPVFDALVKRMMLP